jgi:hypothetical protein
MECFLWLKKLILTRSASHEIHMRDKRFIAQHRGGPMKMEHHRQLIKWACDCAEHVLPLYAGKVDERLNNALLVAKAWETGCASVGDARKAALNAIAVANEVSNSVSVSIARSVGHAAATAHMADHSLGAALYALKAAKSAGKSIDAERKWQNEQLSPDIIDLVLDERSKKEKELKI